MLEPSKFNFANIYSISSILLFVIASFIYYPALLPLMFLMATLVVTSVTILKGWKWGSVAFVITTCTILAVPTVASVGIAEFLTRYIGFTLVSSLLVLVGRRYNQRFAFLDSVIRNSEDAIVTKDLHGKITSFNEGAEHMFGYTSEEVLGKPVTMLFPADRVYEENDILKQLRAGHKIAHYETIRKKKDGTLFPASLSISPVYDFKKKIIGATKIVRDISDAKHIEEQLVKSRERYKAFIDNSEDAIWMVDFVPPINTELSVDEQIEQIYERGVVGEVNAQMLKLYRFNDMQDVVGKSITAITPRTEEGDRFLREFIEKNYNLSGWESVKKDHPNDPRYGLTSFRGIIMQDHLLRGWVVQRETTDRVLQEQELQKSKERYQAFIESSEEAIWRFELTSPIDTFLPTDKQITLIYEHGYLAECNEAMVEQLGHSDKSTLLGKKLCDLVGKTLLSELYLNAFVRKGYNLKHLESTETDGDGDLRYYVFNLSGIIEDGKLIRGWGSQRDITGVKLNAIEKEALLQAAEEAKNVAEIANKEKDRFLANLSHELRTPLVSIVGYSDILQFEEDKDEIKKDLEIINREAKAQLQLIEDLLSVSQAVTGKGRLNKTHFRLAEMISERVESFRYKFAPKGLEVTVDGEDVELNADKGKISQIFNNIFSNAIKFTDKGSIKVTYGRCEPNAYFFTIEDTGIGLAEKDFKNILVPYFQVDNSIIKSKAGVGLGLHIVKTLLNLNKGRIEINSELGKGSTFTVKLPLNGNDLRVLSKTLEGVHILLAEDNDNVGNIIKILLEKEGTVVTWVNSAADVRQVLKENKFDLYLFDVSMPNEDGISLLKSLRKAGDKTHAVAISAYANFEEEALTNGFELFMLKPLTLDKINELRILLA